MWDNNSECAGQAFDQLMLTKSGLGGVAYGVMSTYNGVRMLSTENWSGRSALAVAPTLPMDSTVSADGQPQNKTTSDRLVAFSPPTKSVSTSKATLASPSRKHKDTKRTPSNDSGNNIPIPNESTAPSVTLEDVALPPNTVRTTELVESLDLERKCFASKVYSFGAKGAPNMEAQNKAVIEMICVALLLAEESTKIHKCGLREVPFESVCRKFSLGKDPRVSPSNVFIQDGIDFDRCPTAKHNVFSSLTQVGRGSTAMCCLAVASDAAVCALKIFRKTMTKAWVDTELSNWQALYNDQNGTFMRLSEASGTYVLVLPFLNVPSNAEDRQSFLVGATEQDTLLWKALDGFASKGYAHNDLKWSHVGTLTLSNKKH
jgi:hypothetical protein